MQRLRHHTGEPFRANLGKMKLISVIIIIFFLSGCTIHLTKREIELRLSEFGLKLSEKPNIIRNEVYITHIDYYETVELKLSDEEFKNIKNQITKSNGFANLESYQTGFDKFTTKFWTFGDIFGENHISKDQVISDSLAIAIAYYHQQHKCNWVEKINEYTNGVEFFKWSDGTYGGEIHISQSKKELYYYLMED
jgi:hypothetical protein